MIQRRTRRGRPAGSLGPVSAQVLALLTADPLTAGQVAEELQLSVMVAKYTCSRLAAAGVIRVVRHVRIPGAHRPVSVYGASTSPEPNVGAPSWFVLPVGATA